MKRKIGYAKCCCIAGAVCALNILSLRAHKAFHHHAHHGHKRLFVYMYANDSTSSGSCSAKQARVLYCVLGFLGKKKSTFRKQIVKVLYHIKKIGREVTSNLHFRQMHPFSQVVFSGLDRVFFDEEKTIFNHFDVKERVFCLRGWEKCCMRKNVLMCRYLSKGLCSEKYDRSAKGRATLKWSWLITGVFREEQRKILLHDFI